MFISVEVKAAPGFKGFRAHCTLLLSGNHSDLLADSHNILNRWKNYFSHLLMYIGAVMLGR
jgi:hypothetical protein